MNTYPMYTQQRGAALVISLVMLATATMVGVAGMMGAVTEERIAANQRQITSAFMSAETGVSSGYAQLIDPDTDFQWPDAADWATGNWKPRGDADAGNPMAGSALQDCILVYGAENVVGSPDRIECRPRLKDENNPQAGFIIKVKNSEINARGNTDGNRWYIEHLRFVHAVYEAGEYVYKVPRLDANGDEVKDSDENLVYDTVNHATPGAVQIATMRVRGVVDNAERVIELSFLSASAGGGGEDDKTNPRGGGLGGAINFFGPLDQNALKVANSNVFKVDGQGGISIATSEEADANKLIEAIEDNGRMHNYTGDITSIDFPAPWGDPASLQSFIQEIKSTAPGNSNYFVGPPDKGKISECKNKNDTNCIPSLGSANNRKVTIITGDVEVDMTGNTSGAGILIVEGDLVFKGTPSWDGLIIVLGGKFEINGGGNGGLEGSIYIADIDRSKNPWELTSGNGSVFDVSGGGTADYNWNCASLWNSRALLSEAAKAMWSMDEECNTPPGEDDDTGGGNNDEDDEDGGDQNLFAIINWQEGNSPF